MLNEPVGYNERPADDWTPEIGFARARRAAVLVAIVGIIATAPLAVWLPYVLLPVAIRAPFAFAGLWLAVGFVQRVAGMGHASINRQALIAVGIAPLSHHAAYALHGVAPMGQSTLSWLLFPAAVAEFYVREHDGVLSGWGWFHPYMLACETILPLTAAAAFCFAIQGRSSNL